MKKLRFMITALCMTASISLTPLSLTAFAGQWNSDSRGWWYQNDDGSFTANSWQWIDGNGDGIAECYYFDENGYMLSNTTTPDGQTVDSNGAWVIDSIPQTQLLTETASVSAESAAPAGSTTPTESAAPTKSAAPVESAAPAESTLTVWLSATGSKYHNKPDCGRMNPDKARQISRSEAISSGYEVCSKCY